MVDLNVGYDFLFIRLSLIVQKMSIGVNCGMIPIFYFSLIKYRVLGSICHILGVVHVNRFSRVACLCVKCYYILLCYVLYDLLILRCDHDVISLC